MNPVEQLGKPTMSPSQIALWVESLTPKAKHHTVPGPAMTLRGARKKHPERAERPIGACVHRIRLDEPSGRYVMGRCSLCGFEREYETAPDDLNTSFTVRADRGGRW